ncbi:(d)CMP kinase [bacterium]|nr:(d)CMP kinase [bacterium]
MKKSAIAIDGPAGAGKSTVAKLVASKLGCTYIDTGAMYRAVTLVAIKEGVNLEDEEALVGVAKRIDIKLEGNKVYVDGQDVSSEIRRPKVTAKTRYAAKNEGVRRHLVALQKELGKDGGVVMEGRDIGSVVLKDVRYKFYLDANVEERARRRQKDLLEKEKKIDIEEVKHQIIARDRSDMERPNSPLVRLKEATYIDTTGLTIEEVAEEIIREVR